MAPPPLLEPFRQRSREPASARRRYGYVARPVKSRRSARDGCYPFLNAKRAPGRPPGARQWRLVGAGYLRRRNRPMRVDIPSPSRAEPIRSSGAGPGTLGIPPPVVGSPPPVVGSPPPVPHGVPPPVVVPAPSATQPLQVP